MDEGADDMHYPENVMEQIGKTMIDTIWLKLFFQKLRLKSWLTVKEAKVMRFAGRRMPRMAP
ncbi:hypothetical protein GIX45_04255 [Erwinia sp. CPCC 100877]|nr:hypothetical protein [Erwinia sp. CPCC 100877]